MRKEVIIAIILGSFLGLVLAFGIWRVNKTLNGNKIESGTSTEEQKIDDTSGLFRLTLISPENKTVSVSSYTTVKGLTKPNTYVTISGEDEDTVLLSNEEGSFESEINLVGGVNDLVVTSMNGNDTLEEKAMVVYSNELDNKDEDQENEVEKRVEEASLKYVVRMGTITDITENSVQIKNGSSEILQFAIDENTTYANIVKTSKEVGFEDMAIGDYVLALGTPDENDVLVTKRILISSSYEGTTRKTLVGKVKEFTTKNFTIETKDGEFSLDATGNVTTTYIKDGEIVKGRLSLVDEGDEIIVMGVPNGEDFEVRTVHILPLDNQ